MRCLGVPLGPDDLEELGVQGWGVGAGLGAQSRFGTLRTGLGHSEQGSEWVQNWRD